jgi:hypothetical protein
MQDNNNDYHTELADYNRFAHLLSFKNTVGAPIKRAEIMNHNRNEALLKIREKIRMRSTAMRGNSVDNEFQKAVEERAAKAAT